MKIMRSSKCLDVTKTPSLFMTMITIRLTCCVWSKDQVKLKLQLSSSIWNFHLSSLGQYQETLLCMITNQVAF
jgi:hypothetical protein